MTMTTKVAVDHATPQIPEVKETPEEIVATGTAAMAKINASEAISGAPEVQSNVKAWGVAITALAVNNQSKSTARAQLKLAETAEPALVRRCKVRKRLVLGAIQSAGDGAAQGVQSFNVAVEQRQAKPLAVVPLNVRPMKTKTPSYASVRWDVDQGAKAYVLQHCTNPADATTYSPQISVTAARLHIGGQTPGATVYVRVLAVDPRVLPTGQTAFSGWVAVIVPG
jgi:hypothetical protein